jgi:hypothetical protein
MTKQINSNIHEIYFAPKESLSQEWVNKIREMNTGKPDFRTYSKRIREVFNLEKIIIDEKKQYFLAGFIEGEGSFSVSAKKNPNAKFGLELDPIFNITQHINGVKHLYFALEVFQTGRIRYKAGSNATLVFVIEPRKSLLEKVCPFYEKYCLVNASKAKQIKYQRFKSLLELFEHGAHLDRERFINELLPIWHAMRAQSGYEGQTFQSLEEAQDYIRNFVK